MSGKGGASSVEDRAVGRRAYALALEIHRASLGFPQVEQYALADQRRRASKSVCANVAAGFGRQRLSGADWRRFLAMAVGSADAMQVWMQVWARFTQDLGYADPATAARWRGADGEIARMLAGPMRAWERR